MTGIPKHLRGRRVFRARCGTCQHVLAVRLPERVSALRLMRALTVSHSVHKPFCTGGAIEIPMVTDRRPPFTLHGRLKVPPDWVRRKRGKRRY